MSLISRFKKWRRAFSLRMRLRRQRPLLEATYSHYPKEGLKSMDEIIADFDKIINERGVTNWGNFIKGYSYMGLHYKERKVEDFVSFPEWMDELYKLFALVPEQVAVLDNKYKLNSYLAEHGIRCATGLGLLKAAEGQPVLVSRQGETQPVSKAMETHGAIFCKPTDLGQGVGCFLVEPAPEGCIANGKPMSWEEFSRETVLSAGHEMQVEVAIRQHPAVSAFHAKAVNTLRLTTMIDEATGKPVYFQGMMRMGGGDSYVDNVSQGGACTGITASGQLMRVGCVPAADDAMPNITYHPTSRLDFEGFTIPFFEEAKELVCNAHALFSEKLLFLSWDVAITPDGPCIIECNTRGDVNLLQRFHGGWFDIYRNRLCPAVRRIIAAH